MPNIDDLSISVKSNVTSATNSIDKLITKLGTLSASLGQVNTSGFSAMASGIRQISNASNTISGSSAKNITELSLAIRKFGGKASTQATANIPQLGNALMQLSNSMASVGGMTFNTEGITNLASAINKLGGVKSSTAVQNIPQLTVALQGMVGSLNQIGTAGQSISTLGQLSSSLSKLGGKTVTNAITNIPQLTNALMQMMATLSKAPQVSYNVIQLVNSMANLASQGSKVGTASNSLYNGFMRFGKGADHARKKSFSLASAIGKLYASYFLLFRLFRGIGKGIDLASDLTEVQNVVDVSFGQYRDKIEQFADTSIVDYGMSELTAKQIASRFQAMGGAIGFAQGQMADMSIELTKLAADMASFYNVEQSAVAEDLEAIFTGQTRPLREYGLDLTFATLQEWALSQGMEANIATMTQAEKVLLRYNYVLAQTGMAQGDFARTQGTWANQLRILRQQFEALSAIIGQNFIYALKPLVSALNTVMGKLIQFARVVSNSLGKIFGWKYEDTTGGIADDLEFGAEAADDLGSGLGGAADKAKKLKQQLQGFDELNVLATNTPSSGGGGGGGALGDTDVSATGGQWVRDNTEKFFESDLDTLYKLGDHIGTTLTNQLRSIDWNKVYEGARNFGSGLASFLNGLISPELFSATGATIAGALNTAIYASLSFGQEFDFEEFGLSIAEGINTFFRDTDFKALGQDIKTWVEGLRTTLITIIKEVEWGEILSGVGDVLSSLDAETIATLFGFKALSLLFKGNLFATLGSTLAGITTLPASLTTGLSGITTLIFKSFVGGLTTAFVGFNLGEWIYENITGDNTSDINYFDYLFGDAKATAEEWGNAVAQLEADILGIDTYNSISEKILEQKEKAKKDLEKATYFAEKSGMAVSDNKLVYEIQVMLGGEAKYKDALKSIGQSTYTNIKKAVNTMEFFGLTTEEVSNIATESFNKIKDGSSMFETLRDAISSITGEITNGTTEKFNTLKENATNIFDYIKTTITGKTEETKTNTETTVQTMSDNATAIFGTMASTMTTDATNGTKNVLDKYLNLSNSATETVGQMSDNTLITLSDLHTGAVSETTNMSNDMLGKFESVKSGSEDKFEGVKKTVINSMAMSKDIIASQDWRTPGINLVEGLKSGIASKWTTGTGSLLDKIVSLAGSLTSALQEEFDIHSPSRVWRDDVGRYLTMGLSDGVLSEEGNLINSIVGMGERLTNSFNGSLTLATPSTVLGGSYNFGVTSTMAHQFTADTSMTSNIADGVRLGLSTSQAEQNALLREQNELLMQILEKDTGISQKDIFDAVRRENRQRYNATGTNQLVY